MQNSYDKSRDFGAVSVRDWLTDLSPILIIGAFVLSLASFGVLKFNYHSELLTEQLPSIGYVIAFAIALVSQVARFAFGLAGVRDLVRGRTWMGWLGVCASIALSVYEHFEAARMAAYWENPHLWHLLVFLVWVALAAEIRLLMTMSENPAAGKKSSGSRRNGVKYPAGSAAVDFTN